MPSRGRLPRPEYPRPQFVRNDWLCLNGPWAFAEDAGRNGDALGWQKSGRFPGRIVVPFPPESRLSGIGKRDFMPCVWYSRKFRVPAAWKGRRVLLHFGAVDYEATAWVNGQEAAFHRGGYSPFACDVTELLSGRENLLVVRAIDDMCVPKCCGKQSAGFLSSGCHYTRITGIWQTVWLEPVNATNIRSVRLIPDLAAGQVHVQADIQSPSSGLTLLATVRAEGKVVGRESAPAGAVAAMTIDLDRIRPWDIDDPFLYDLELLLRAGDGVVDRASSYFGLRSIRLDPPAVLLNERPLFQRLVLDQGYHPAGLYTAPSDAHLKRDIVLSRKLGFNGARLHERVFEERFLYWADRLGYLVWGEFGDWGINRAEGEAWRRLSAEWTTIVQRDFNHPSIVGWCPCNEGGPRPDPQMQRDLYRLTKALDPTRPVIDSSGWYHYETDIYDCHCYEQDLARFKAAFADFAKGGQPPHNKPDMTRYAGQPFFVSEYGGTWWKPGQRAADPAWGYGQRPVSRKDFVERYRGLTTALLKHPRIAGFCYTQLYDIEQEVNGLMTYDRKMKFDPALIARINRQPAAIENVCENVAWASRP